MASVRVTALCPGDGEAVAALWRDLWILHESWQGYRAAREDAVYTSLAGRLESWAQRRHADPVLGQHIHLVARDEAGTPLGQVEGWLDRHGLHAPHTCEIRSLIVAPDARGVGVGRALLRELEALACRLTRSATFAVAEVLVPNPSYAFYLALGYRPISVTKMLAVEPGRSAAHARAAVVGDAMAVATLEMERRRVARESGDLRLDRPSAVDASFTSAVARHLAMPALGELVVHDGRLVAQGSFRAATLEAPFVPVVRAALGRVAAAPGAQASVLPLVGLALERARRRGAPRLELSDLSIRPDDPVARTLEAAGAVPFSRIVGRLIP